MKPRSPKPHAGAALVSPRRMARSLFRPKKEKENDLDNYLLKIQLIDEIDALRQEVAGLDAEIVQKEKRFGINTEGFLQFPTYDQISTKIEITEASDTELDSQISFFSSMFSESNLEKLKKEVQQHKDAIEQLTSDTRSIQINQELVMLDLDNDNLSGKITEMQKLGDLQAKYQEQIKFIEKETDAYARQYKELMNHNHIQHNTRKLIVLTKQYQCLLTRKMNRQTALQEAKKTAEAHKMIQAALKESESKLMKENLNRKKAAEIFKEKNRSLEFSHTLMPMETLISPRRQKKRTVNSHKGDKLFEMTQLTIPMNQLQKEEPISFS